MNGWAIFKDTHRLAELDRWHAGFFEGQRLKAVSHP
jgi:hypothetical protein